MIANCPTSPMLPFSPSSPNLPAVIPQAIALLTQVAEVWLPRVMVIIIYMGHWTWTSLECDTDICSRVNIYTDKMSGYTVQEMA